jgi:23S rRNA maturation mini-RNase III
MLNKEAYLIISVVLAIIIGVAIYDYQVRKMFAETIKRIATMGNLKKVAKSPALLWAFILGLFFDNEK